MTYTTIKMKFEMRGDYGNVSCVYNISPCVYSQAKEYAERVLDQCFSKGYFFRSPVPEGTQIAYPASTIQNVAIEYL